MKTKILIASGLLLIILTIGILIFSISLYIKGKPNQSTQTPPQTTALKPTPVPEEKAVEFKLELGPQSVGRVISTDYLSATSSGWLVIHQDNRSSVGKLVEAAIPPVTEGVKRGETFILSEELQPGTYWALVYQGKGLFFEEGKSNPAANLKGEAVKAMFTVK